MENTQKSCNFLQTWYNVAAMKRVIEVDGMCCKRCAERAERKLLLLDGVTGAKANFKKGLIFVETTLPDSALAECIADAGFQATLIRDRRGLFG